MTFDEACIAIRRKAIMALIDAGVDPDAVDLDALDDAVEYFAREWLEFASSPAVH